MLSCTTIHIVRRTKWHLPIRRHSASRKLVPTVAPPTVSALRGIASAHQTSIYSEFAIASSTTALRGPLISAGSIARFWETDKHALSSNHYHLPKPFVGGIHVDRCMPIKIGIQRCGYLKSIGGWRRLQVNPFPERIWKIGCRTHDCELVKSRCVHGCAIHSAGTYCAAVGLTPGRDLPGYGKTSASPTDTRPGPCTCV